MTFQTVAELLVKEHRGAAVYAEGWQTWSPMRLYRFGEASERPADERSQVVMFRPSKPIPEGVIQAEGLLAVGPVDGPARAWFAPDPARDVATIRLAPGGEVWADGRVEEIVAADLAGVLAAAGDRLGAGPTRAIPAGWCSWSYYFKQVTEADVVENAEAARRLELPLEIVQVDDGYETEIGDWLDVRPEFGSLERLAQRIEAVGMRPGIWIPPFMVSPASMLATHHPGWLVRGADAGMHWGQRMRILDITNPAAAEYVAHVFQTFTRWGYTYFKLDFLYAAAIPGIEVYRRGMQLIREAVGPDAIILIGGAPLLPSIGLCDAMRVGPDVLPEVPEPQLDLDAVVRITTLRWWMNRRLWVNDPDCLVARPEIQEREAWAAHVERYGGVRFSSDRLAALDDRGIELTRRFLSQAEHGQ